MEKKTFAVLIGVTMLLSAFTINRAVNWKIADHYAIKFAGTDAEGMFSKFSGEIVFDENDLASSRFATSIEVESISTGNGMKNKHARSEKWFNVKEFPFITFTSNKFTKTTEGYAVEGMLELHGVKKPVTIPFTFTDHTFRASFAVNRMDYGVGTMDGMSKKVSNEIKLDIAVPVTR